MNIRKENICFDRRSLSSIQTQTDSGCRPWICLLPRHHHPHRGFLVLDQLAAHIHWHFKLVVSGM
jgi:hypothetical protein